MSAAVAAALILLTALLAGPSSALGPYPDLAGCPVFPDPPAGLSAKAPSLPDQSAWNQDISKAPVTGNSTATIAYINRSGDDLLHPDFGSPSAYGFPLSIVGAGQPRLPIVYTAYGAESDQGPFPIPADAPVEGGSGSDGDRHVIAIDRDACVLYEIYRGFPGGDRWRAESGAEWDLRSPARHPNSYTSADAAGLPIYPGLVRYDEVASGRLEHAIRVTFESTRHAWINPAVHCAGDSDSAAAPAMGARLRLKAGYRLRGFSGASRVIAIALKRYGMIVADNGSNWYFSGTSDSRWDDENLNQLKRIPGSAFQVVRSRARTHVC